MKKDLKGEQDGSRVLDKAKVNPYLLSPAVLLGSFLYGTEDSAVLRSPRTNRQLVGFLPFPRAPEILRRIYCMCKCQGLECGKCYEIGKGSSRSEKTKDEGKIQLVPFSCLLPSISSSEDVIKWSVLADSHSMRKGVLEMLC